MIWFIVLGVIVALLLFGMIVGLLFKLALLLLVAFVASAAAQALVKSKGGFIFTFVTGLIGAVIGLVIANLLNAPTWPRISGLPILWTLAGSIVVVAVAKVALPARARQAGGRLFR